MADLDGARELGIPSASIAVGALLFSATIDRTAPEMSGIPLSLAARIQARRGIALLLSAGVFAFGAWMSGSRSTNLDGSFAGTTVALLTALIIPVLAMIAAVAGLIAFWRAAFVAGILAKVTAALATVGVLSIPLSVLAMSFSAWRDSAGALALVALLTLIAAAIVGVISWAGSSQPVEVIPAPAAPTMPPPRQRIPRWALVTTIAVGGVLALGTLVVPGIAMLLILPALAIAAVVLAVYAIRRRTSGRRPVRESMAIGCMAVALLLLVGVGTLDLLVLSPQWMAPGFTLDEIFAALSPEDLSSGVAIIYAWIAIWVVASLVYLAVAITAVRGATPATHWMLVAGFATIAAMVFFQFWAGFGLGNSISDTLPPFQGGRHDVGVLYGIVGQFSLVFALWGAIAPRAGAVRRAEVRPTGPPLGSAAYRQ